MSSEQMYLRIDGVPDEQLPEVERQVAVELVSLLQMPTDDEVLTLEQIIDRELLRDRDYDEVVELSRKFPHAKFRLFAYGDQNGGWPWVQWVQDGKLLYEWDSCEQMPDEYPAAPADMSELIEALDLIEAICSGDGVSAPLTAEGDSQAEDYFRAAAAARQLKTLLPELVLSGQRFVWFYEAVYRAELDSQLAEHYGQEFNDESLRQYREVQDMLAEITRKEPAHAAVC